MTTIVGDGTEYVITRRRHGAMRTTHCTDVSNAISELPMEWTLGKTQSIPDPEA